MQVVILAGGLATRLQSLARAQPKSMMEIAGKPFLEHQLSLLAGNGLRKVVLCVGHLHERIVEYFGNGSPWGVQLSYSYDRDRLLGTGGALRNAEALLEEKFLVMYGDAYLRVPYQDVCNAFQNSQKRGLMVVYQNRGRFDRSNVAVERGMVTLYDMEKRFSDLEYVDYGLSVLKRDTLTLLPAGVASPLGRVFSALASGGQLAAYEAHQRFFEIGSPASLEEFRRFIERGGRVR